MGSRGLLPEGSGLITRKISERVSTAVPHTPSPLPPSPPRSHATSNSSVDSRSLCHSPGSTIP
eukprot:1145837-Rhodomonas_salina.1